VSFHAPTGCKVRVADAWMDGRTRHFVGAVIGRGGQDLCFRGLLPSWVRREEDEAEYWTKYFHQAA
jgi:hypothetical protein